MPVVHYVGSSDFRTVTTANFTAAGVVDQTAVTFSKTNNWQANVSATASTYLLTFVDFSNAGITRPVAVTGPDSSYLQATLVDAKGDLLVGTADNAVTRLPAGTNGFVLTTDSAVAGGLKWVATVIKQAAQVDTTGATLAALETEVNGLKAKLRAAGVIA